MTPLGYTLINGTTSISVSVARVGDVSDGTGLTLTFAKQRQTEGSGRKER